MAFQFSPTLRNAMVSSIQTTAGSSGVTLVIYTGTEPANTAASEVGTALCTITLPATFLTSTSGVATIAGGPWSGTASATGTAGHFRLLSGSTVVLQGDVISDLILQNTSIATGQSVVVNSFTVTQGNA